MIFRSEDEMLRTLGENLRAERLQGNISQQAAAERSGISLKALRNIESGANASTHSLMALCRTLKKTDWIVNLAPPEMTREMFESVRPLKHRQRAAKRKEVSHG